MIAKEFKGAKIHAGFLGWLYIEVPKEGQMKKPATDFTDAASSWRSGGDFTIAPCSSAV